ncbi:MAG: imidazole glycerol phosphate synthase subunit HisH [Clostridia bacterium]
MSAKPRVAVADTGRCNLASMMAALQRNGADPYVCADPQDIVDADYAVLPGVGAFGPVAERLRISGLGPAFANRIRAEKPTLAVCLGMQLIFEGSEESPGEPGIGALPGTFKAFGPDVRSPLFGWNLVSGAGSFLSEPGWAYFAHSYRLEEVPPGWKAASSEYGGSYASALEKGPMLLCQFHPELSGDWGGRLLSRWLGTEPGTARGQTPGGSAGAMGRSSDGQAGAQGQSPGGPAKRIIPCLDVDGGRVVKGVRFKELRDMGDPAELAARYEREGADELVILDITAGIRGVNTAADVVRSVRAVMGIPLCVGGGIRSIADAERLLAAGADKVSINSRAYRDPELVSAIAREFGSQCCVVAVDAARGPDGVPMVVLDAGHSVMDESVYSWIARAAELGAGEILLTSRDRDGTGSGYDHDLLREAVRAAPGIPVIASGGASTPEQILGGFTAGADAALLAGALHDGRLSIGEIKDHVRRSGVEVRIC